MKTLESGGTNSRMISKTIARVNLRTCFASDAESDTPSSLRRDLELDGDSRVEDVSIVTIGGRDGDKIFALELVVEDGDVFGREKMEEEFLVSRSERKDEGGEEFIERRALRHSKE